MSWNSEQPSNLAGCLLTWPAATVGTFMILEYPGPPGPLGFAEFFGWWAVSLGVAVVSSRAFFAFLSGRHRLLALAAFVTLPAILTSLLWLEVQPTTSATIKAVVEYALQAIGMLALAGILVFVGRIWWTSRRPHHFG